MPHMDTTAISQRRSKKKITQIKKQAKPKFKDPCYSLSDRRCWHDIEPMLLPSPGKQNYSQEPHGKTPDSAYNFTFFLKMRVKCFVFWSSYTNCINKVVVTVFLSIFKQLSWLNTIELNYAKTIWGESNNFLRSIFAYRL